MVLRPVGDRIVLKIEMPPRMSEGGIYYPEAVNPAEASFGIWNTVLERQVGDHAWATVIATGPGRRSKRGVRIPTGVKPGDRVYAQINKFDLASREKDNPGEIRIVQTAHLLVVAP